MVARSKEDAEAMLRDRSDGVPIRTIIGRAVLAGEGKPPPFGPVRVVQLRNTEGAVYRESVVLAQDAVRVAESWGPNAVILSISDVLERRRLETLH